MNLFLGLLGLLLALRDLSEQLLSLDDQALLAPLAHLLVLVAARLGLLGQLLGAGVLRLLLEDVLHQVALVLEGVALALEVQVVVEVLVDLLGITVLLQQVPQNPDPPHPQHLLGHARVLGTATLTEAGVAALNVEHALKSKVSNCEIKPKRGKQTYLAASLGLDAGAEARVHLVGLLDDQTILDQAADVLTGVGIRDLVDLVGVEPDLAFAALQHGRGETLLELQGTKTRRL